jgi:hypothetical protein
MKEDVVKNLAPKYKLAIYYHSLFDFPLKEMELLKWEVAEKVARKNNPNAEIDFKDGFYFVKGKIGVITTRQLRQRNSEKKERLARKYGQYLQFIPTIKAVCLTGSLAMGNASEEADIDFLVITKKGTLWLSRLITLLCLRLISAPVRRFGEKEVKDKLCFNLWLDEANLVWPKGERNIFTAHEIAQIKPLVNKEQTFEHFLFKNSWIKEYWPNAVQIKEFKKIKVESSVWSFFEPLARSLQMRYMKGKRTKEKVSKGKAVFHPQILSSEILQKFSSFTS